MYPLLVVHILLATNDPLHPVSRFYPDAPFAADPMVEAMVASVSEDSVIAMIQYLEDYGSRSSLWDEQFQQVVDWTDSWFGLHWIPSEIQHFTFTQSGQYHDCWNVLASITGQVHPEQVYIVCGHLDSTSEDSTVAPGADDNGSGSAAVLEAARVMAPYDYEYSVKFILFGAEEENMKGSLYYVQHLPPGELVMGVINVDMILYAPDDRDSLEFICCSSDTNQFAEQAVLYVQEYAPQSHPRLTYDPDAWNSDHSVFYFLGMDAIWGRECALDDNPYNHTPNDLLANYMSYFPFGTDCVRGIVAAAASFAGPIGPSGVGGGAPGSGDLQILRINPNPTSGIIQVSLESPSDASVSISVFDLSGHMVRPVETLAEDCSPWTLDLTAVPAGVYLVRWIQDDLSGSERLVILN
ncbi:MAG: M28 family peptidase [Candidatus Fermentibacter sp.]|nr:M28 family peptidase [Candidatus Fermentibacter sp.]